MKDTGRISTILLSVMLVMMVISTAFGAVDVTAEVGNETPTVGDIQVCDGTCGYAKTLDPATEFTIQVVVTDPNGAVDLNSFDVEFYKDADQNGGAVDWDANAITDVQSATANGCTATGDTYCLTVPAGSWTTKFLNGGTKVFVRATDDYNAQDFNEASLVTVNGTVGHSEDTTSGGFGSVSANTTNNAFTSTQTANAWIVATSNANQNIDVSVTATAMTSGGDTIVVGNLHWDNDGTPAGADFTGGADVVQATFGRGTDPTSGTFNVYTWVDIDDLQPSGSYSGTYTYSSVAS